jgi:hypothetical protein
VSANNPYTPSFGVQPPVLVGRDRILDQFDRGLDEGIGALERSTLIVGPRGSGKSVALAALADVASARRWVIVRDAASPGIINRLVQEEIPRQTL